MLNIRTVMRREGLMIADVACRHRIGTGTPEQYTGQPAVVFVRRGCFDLSANGAPMTLDATTAYGVNPGDEQRYDHPHDEGDDCTVFGLDDRLLGELATVRGLPTGPWPTPPRIDLEHRLLLTAARRDADEHMLFEQALGLIETTIRGAADGPRARATRGAQARQALVANAREALTANPERSLSSLAEEFSVSPFHLSRTFRSLTGHTLARHRMRLRARSALERLAAGERDLARLAADLGFADQGHLCRVIRAETSTTPAALRRALE